MAARRIRIKGIANIPVRRKNEVSNADKITTKEELSAKNQDVDENSEPIATVQTVESQAENEKTKEINTENSQENSDKSDENNTLLGDNAVNENVLVVNNFNSNDSDSLVPSNLNNNELTEKDENKNDSQDVNQSHTSVIDQPQTEQKLSRRWKPRPSVKIPAVPRKPKLNTESACDISTTNTPHETSKDSNSDVSNKEDNIISDENINEVLNSAKTQETESISHNNSNENTTLDCISSQVSNTTKENFEPTLISPLSPSKTVNRARIKPVPRFIRRSSVQGSASESEDDGRRTYNRIRNDSVCSTATVDSCNNREDLTLKPRQVTIISHKRSRTSERYRKLAMARKEFYLKFGSQTPDRKKLTMMDLIYYNPTTNPMPEKPTKAKGDTTEIVEIINQNEEEAEKEDDPDNPPEQGSDEENIPVPQVKVGPNGEIILDKESLIIEQTGAKKGREQLQNSEIVIDDLDTGYGIYKRPKKGKDWSMTETLRFYRTLNTVGTDFSLMLSLFPGRTRRELKLKFKKEERINRVLIDKVLTNPLDFNLSELEKQFEEEQEISSIKKKRTAKVKNLEKNAKKRKRNIKTSILGREIDDANETDLEENAQKRPKSRKKNEKCDQYSILEKGLDSVIDSNSDDEEYIPRMSLFKTDDTVLKQEDTGSKLPQRSCRVRSSGVYKTIFGSDESEDEEVDRKVNSKRIENVKINRKAHKNQTNENDANADDLAYMTKINNMISEETNRLSGDTRSHLDAKSPSKQNDEDEECAEDMEVETNVVIAHSENAEPDRISIDILSKNQHGVTSTETKVSLELKKEGDSLLQIENIADTDSENVNKKKEENDTDSKEDAEQMPEELPQMEPGSLMILSSFTPTGEKVFKVYMVTENQENIPIDLSPDIVKSLTTSLGSSEEVELDLPVVTDEG